MLYISESNLPTKKKHVFMWKTRRRWTHRKERRRGLNKGDGNSARKTTRPTDVTLNYYMNQNFLARFVDVKPFRTASTLLPHCWIGLKWGSTDPTHFISLFYLFYFMNHSQDLQLLFPIQLAGGWCGPFQSYSERKTPLHLKVSLACSSSLLNYWSLLASEWDSLTETDWELN